MDQGELRRLESKCIQENPPACTSGCPIHVDARKLMLSIQSQDWKSAAAIIQQKQPFPGIISRICDHPCEVVCKRKDAGASVAISALERFCLENHAPKPANPKPITPKSKTVAVVGGGLRGLTAAYDIARKGYEVTLFDKAARLGGKLWDFPEQKLPPAIIEAELTVLNRLNVTIEINREITRVALPELQTRFDAVYLGLAAQSVTTLELLGEYNGVDPITCATPLAGVFAGGVVGNNSPINAVADGRTGALSIDRFLQGVSLTASREGEGAYESKLFINLNGIPSLPAVTMNNELGYTSEEAVNEAGRCLNCQCLECVKACKYLESYRNYPKKYLREIYNNESIVMGTRHANKMINSCSICGLCAEVCPNELDMGQVCQVTRESMVTRGKMPPSAHDFALRDMAFSNSEHFTLTRHQPGFNSSKYVFFPGCQLSGSSPEHVEKVYSNLTAQLAGGVGLMLRCCGAPAFWAGEQEQFQTSFAETVAEWEKLGKPQLIVACSSCYSMFREKLPVVSLWELLEKMDLPVQDDNDKGVTIAVQDACTTRHEPAIHAAVRQIISRLGYEIEELPYSKELTKCCGFGGLTGFANPGLAGQIVEDRINESTADYVTYCAMCRDRFAAKGKRTLHLLDLIFGQSQQDAATRRDPGFSQRHEHRARLKKKFLHELWQEQLPTERSWNTIKLICDEEVRVRLEERLILIEDVQQVIEHAERTGRKFTNPANTHYLAYFRPARVTYWVEYQPLEEGFVILNAYSHRMEIVEEVKS